MDNVPTITSFFAPHQRKCPVSPSEDDHWLNQPVPSPTVVYIFIFFDHEINIVFSLPPIPCILPPLDTYNTLLASRHLIHAPPIFPIYQWDTISRSVYSIGHKKLDVLYYAVVVARSVDYSSRDVPFYRTFKK